MSDRNGQGLGQEWTREWGEDRKRDLEYDRSWEVRPQRRGGRWWRWPGTALILLVEAILFIVVIGGTALAWRAAQGPVNLSLLLPKIGRAIALAAPQLDVSIGQLAVAWKGFTQGPDQPVQVTASAIRVDEPGAQRTVAIARLSLDLSAAWAVRGVLAPRSVTLVEPSLTQRRWSALPPQGPQPLVGRPISAHDMITVLERPPETDRHLVKVRPASLSELTRVTILGGQILVEPAAATPDGKSLHGFNIAGVVTRGAAGGLSGRVSGNVSVIASGQPAPTEPPAVAGTPAVSATVTLGTTGIARVLAQARVDDPAALVAAIAPPQNGPNGIPIPSMPLRLTADVTTAPDLTVTALKATVTGTQGNVLVDGARIPVSGLVLGVTGDRDHLAVDPGSHVAFGAVSAQPPPTLALGGSAQLSKSGVTAEVTLGIDHVASDDLPAYWPPDVAPGARKWISAQVHDGLLHDGAFQIGLSSGPNFANLGVGSASGAVQANGLTVIWLPPLPPMTAVQGSIALLGPDAVGVTVTGASQGDLRVGQSTMVITGLSAPEQIGAITVNVAGPVATVLTLLNQPRLHLLKSVPVPLKATSGTIATNVALTLPLDAKVTLAQIQAKVHADIENLALQNLALGRSLTGGQFTIDADTNALKLTGAAALASIPMQLTLDADLTAGPPTQVIANVALTATADQVALAKAGIPTAGVLKGPAQFALALKATRGGRTDINAKITLPEANLQVAPISWSGGAGQATATAHVALQGSQIVALDSIKLQAPDAALKVHSVFAEGRLSTLFVDRLLLGRTDLHGSLGFPAHTGDPYVVDVAGPALDLSKVWGGGVKPQPSVAPANQALSTISSKAEFQAHPPWRAQVALDRILFGTLPNGGSRELDHVSGLVVNNGVVVQSAQVAFMVEPSRSQAHLSIVPDGNGSRSVTLTSGDFGGLLKATNAYDLVSGGVLRIDGTYDDRVPNHPLSGTCEMDSFTLGDAPTAARVLAAMTLYGVVDLLHGKGLFFRKLIMPFHLADQRLQLTQARAYSSSLGLTAHGSIDLPHNRFDILGTIVPAYFFNSLLGNIPLIGKYFSPEKGGGVFAAKYELVGPIDNPQVHVYPSSLITPGFLRGVFGH
ncbi:DUF3971 domain-containing protein [Acidisoma sp.]|uniref:YhdP family protein n=1 Tax=Acidisoma sp. TaxID=1872115 RepID=UPI003AFF68A8